MRVRVSTELRKAIEELAAKDNRIMSSWIETTLKNTIEEARRKK